jgi:hypothetical protein
MSSTSQIGSEPTRSSIALGGETGFVRGGVRVLLRLEGLATLATAIALYAHAGFSWIVFVVFFLAPDLSMLGYLFGSRVGASAYNFFHTYVPAVALATLGFFADVRLAFLGGLIWIAHIGLDRGLGYGLKYQSGFGSTHLGRIGRR